MLWRSSMATALPFLHKTPDVPLCTPKSESVHADAR